MKDPDQIVDALQTVLAHERDGFAEQLVASLCQARAQAEAELNPALLHALPWPKDIEAYCEYLRGFIRWIPRQSDAEAWKVSAPNERYAKEVSDRLGHFFWLVDQPVVGDGGTLGENSAAFRDWLTEFARQWGNYHRYHVPVSGTVAESFVIQGRVYMQVKLQDGELVSLDSAKSGYEFSQTRGVVTIDTGDSLGIVAVVPVGMAHVASVNLTAVAGKQVAKGDEFGYFQFGGSDIIVLFQAGVLHPEVDTNTDLRPVGSVIARCRV